jgi:predicted acetyltransferase
MSASKLVKPDVIYKDSFIEAIKEFHAEGRYLFLNITDLEKDFEGFIKNINSKKKHLHKPFQDWADPVPESIVWMVKEHKFIGSLTVRHRLNWHLEKWGGHLNFIIRPSMRNKGFGKKLLQKAIPAVAHLGIEKALLTVAPENNIAVRVIEFCGGKLENETSATDKFPARKRFWLNCT